MHAHHRSPLVLVIVGALAFVMALTMLVRPQLVARLVRRQSGHGFDETPDRAWRKSVRRVGAITAAVALAMLILGLTRL